MRKAFSEVVSGIFAADSGFPSILQREKSSPGLDKSNQKTRARDHSVERTSDKGTRKSEDVLSVRESFSGTNSTNVDPYLQIGSNVVSVDLNKMSPSLKHVIVYVGFEHECPHGHRVLLNPEHLNELGTSYQVPKESQENSDHSLPDNSKLSRNGFRGKVHRDSNRMAATAANKERHVTPPFPVILATCPVIQFEASCLPPSIPEREQKLQFNLGSQVVLPAESFVTLRLPFMDNIIGHVQEKLCWSRWSSHIVRTVYLRICPRKKLYILGFGFIHAEFAKAALVGSTKVRNGLILEPLGGWCLSEAFQSCGNVIIVWLKESNFEVEAWKCNGEKSYPEETSVGSNDFQCHRLIFDVVACELCYFNRFRIWIEVFSNALAFEGHKSGQYRQGLPFGDCEDVRGVRVLLCCTVCLHACTVVRFLAEQHCIGSKLDVE
ncbi:hypothetical protein D8674_006355 [Pyrus ussuriensis x Pyrus communis]|uniref:Nonsense-mediated mRNA decay factor SMG8 n=1 Tax=Pyrus ussuriensis x Pyrus communis TaxID=2448454 RepID=A0A5N5FU11_9ROSA|nr:hypothetical protein D8674_006355 [Pyrus ussuriensis x Pyrus communis]